MWWTDAWEVWHDGGMGKTITLGGGSLFTIAGLALGRETIWWGLTQTLDSISAGVKSMKWSEIDWGDTLAVICLCAAAICIFWDKGKEWWKRPSECTLVWSKFAQDDERFDRLITALDVNKAKTEERLLVAEATIVVLNKHMGNPTER